MQSQGLLSVRGTTAGIRAATSARWMPRSVMACPPHQQVTSTITKQLHTSQHHAQLSACNIFFQRPRHVCSATKVSELPASLQKVVGAFQMVPDPMARYKQLLFYANKLQPLPAEDHVPSNKVEGCVSQVWVKPELKEDGKLYWQADSDSQLTKGLAALLVLGLSGCTPEEILRLQPDFIEMLGLKQSLTPSRNNGFLNMFKLMQRKTLEVAAAKLKQQESSNGNRSSNATASANSNGSHSSGTSAAQALETSSTTVSASISVPAQPPAAASSSSSSSSSSSRTPVQDGIRRKLTEALQPSRLVIEDQSSQHAGHAAMRAVAGKAGSSGETHFRVDVVSAAFEGMSQVMRHRLVYQLLQEEFGMGLHALSLDTRTPLEAA